jgi:hypothetical protein
LPYILLPPCPLKGGKISLHFGFCVLTRQLIGVNLRIGYGGGINGKKISPPFEGGVVGKIDYQICIELFFPTGVVDSFISCFFMKSHIFFEREALNPSDHHSKTITLMLVRGINQPPRPVSAFVTYFNSGPATPPSKGGEMYGLSVQRIIINFGRNYIAILLNLSS